MKRILHLHLKFKWFDQLPPNGDKLLEYRLDNDYWRKRLAKDYDEVWFYRGYQKAIEGETLYKRKYVKPLRASVVSSEWNNAAKMVFAIPTNRRIK